LKLENAPWGKFFFSSEKMFDASLGVWNFLRISFSVYNLLIEKKISNGNKFVSGNIKLKLGALSLSLSLSLFFFFYIFLNNYLNLLKICENSSFLIRIVKSHLLLFFSHKSPEFYFIYSIPKKLWMSFFFRKWNIFFPHFIRLKIRNFQWW